MIEKLGKRGRIEILDGKADFMVTSEKPPKEWLERQRELGSEDYKGILRKVETHLMFFSAEEFYKYTSGADLDLDAGEEIRHDENDCGCELSATTIVAEIENEMSRLRSGEAKQPLPIEHRYAIDNALFLLAATLRDSSICCDVRDAVLACFGGLLKILKEIGEQSKASPPSRYRRCGSASTNGIASASSFCGSAPSAPTKRFSVRATGRSSIRVESRSSCIWPIS